MLPKGSIESILMGLSFTVLNAKTAEATNNESEGDANCWTDREVAREEQRVSENGSIPAPTSVHRFDLSHLVFSMAATDPSLCPSAWPMADTSACSAIAPFAGVSTRKRARIYRAPLAKSDPNAMRSPPCDP